VHPCDESPGRPYACILNLSDTPTDDWYAALHQRYDGVHAYSYNFNDLAGTSAAGEITYALKKFGSTAAVRPTYAVTIDGDGAAFEWAAPAYHACLQKYAVNVIAGGTHAASIVAVRVTDVKLNTGLVDIIGRGCSALKGLAGKDTVAVQLSEGAIVVPTRALADIVALTSMNDRDPATAVQTIRAITANVHDRIRHNEYGLAQVDALRYSAELAPKVVSAILSATADVDVAAVEQASTMKKAHAVLGEPKWYQLWDWAAKTKRVSMLTAPNIAALCMALFMLWQMSASMGTGRTNCIQHDGRTYCASGPAGVGSFNATLMNEQFCHLLNATVPNTTASWTLSGYINNTLTSIADVKDYGIRTTLYAPVSRVLLAIWRVLDSLAAEGPIRAAIVLVTESVNLVGSVARLLADVVATFVPRENRVGTAAVPHALVALSAAFL